MKEHDQVLKGNVVVKIEGTERRPHADGCVGCRRDGVCIKCGKPSTLDLKVSGFITRSTSTVPIASYKATGKSRCISGACITCCIDLHKHVDNDPTKVCERR